MLTARLSVTLIVAALPFTTVFGDTPVIATMSRFMLNAYIASPSNW